jgi:hypothetical protein
VDPQTGEQVILCVASNKYTDIGNQLLRIDGDRVYPVPDAGLPWSLSSIWFVPGEIYIIAGDGIYLATTPALPDTWSRDTTFQPIYKHAVRGLAPNDIVVAGAFGLLSHYNGSTWKHYLYDELPFIIGKYHAVAIHEKVVVAVGEMQGKAVVLVGRRDRSF